MAVRRALVRRAAAWTVAWAALGLTSCGGGISVGFGCCGDFDDFPSVSLAASVDTAQAGDPIRLSAAASDDFGVDFVIFYRLESDGSATRLGSDGVGPFQWDTTMPSTTAASVQFFARAVDGAGQASDSALVSVTRSL
jgi:Big-like domain-containing protein